MANVRTELRIPEDLHARIKAMADEEMRSMNAQIILMLKKLLPPEGEAKEDKPKKRRAFEGF